MISEGQRSPFLCRGFYLVVGVLFLLVLKFPVRVQAEVVANRYLSMSLEELMNIEVTSAFKRPQSLRDTAAAVFVITREDIRRSGVTHFADLLRMVPGVNVAQVYSNRWAVSIRGFNEEYYSSKILLLIDGRSVYSPIFPTVMWDENDIPLEEIERVEVVRGPGGATWGANAVNGIINIITRKASDTQGGLLSVGGGNEERGFGYLGYGGRVGENAFYRIYLKGMSRDGSHGTTSFNTRDDWYDYRGGGRLDWEGDSDELSVMGDLHWSRQKTSRNIFSYSPPYNERHNSHMGAASGDLNLKWKHLFSDCSRFSVQTYYQFTNRNRYDYDSSISTFDIETSYLFSPLPHNSVQVGAGYRLDVEDIDSKWYMDFNNPHRKDETVNIFLQDQISLFDNRLIFTGGAKFEHNHYTGWEVQPSLRVLLKATENLTLWGAVSMAVHTPDMFSRDLRWVACFSPPTGNRPFVFNISTSGDKNLVSERMWAYETGGRWSLGDRVNLDVALYFDHYNHLVGLSAPEGPVFSLEPVAHMEYPLKVTNTMDGDVYGAEISANILLLPNWRIMPAYTFTKMYLWSTKRPFVIYDEKEMERKTPRHQFSLRSQLTLFHQVELDTWLRHVSSLEGVSSYTAFDARIGWRPKDNIEISISGRNLFDNHHLEFVPLLMEQPPSEVERSVYAKVSVWF